jgi:hypothetical protein
MAGAFKVRLQDGSEVGPLDIQMMRSWYQQGLVDGNSQVLPSGKQKWVRLAQAVDLQDWSGGAAPIRAKPGMDDDPEGDLYDGEEEAGPQAWRTYVGSALCFLAAAGAAYFAFFPDRWLPSLAVAPWKELALAHVALGLLLVRGWDNGRKLVRVLLFLMTFSLFPLAGFVLVQGGGQAALVVMASAWIMGSGLFFFLSGRDLHWRSAALCLLWVLAGAAGVGYFGFVPHAPRAAPPPLVNAGP